VTAAIIGGFLDFSVEPAAWAFADVTSDDVPDGAEVNSASVTIYVDHRTLTVLVDGEPVGSAGDTSTPPPDVGAIVQVDFAPTLAVLRDAYTRIALQLTPDPPEHSAGGTFGPLEMAVDFTYTPPPPPSSSPGHAFDSAVAQLRADAAWLGSVGDEENAIGELNAEADALDALAGEVTP
jgi:hypothetical protein